MFCKRNEYRQTQIKIPIDALDIPEDLSEITEELKRFVVFEQSQIQNVSLTQADKEILFEAGLPSEYKTAIIFDRIYPSEGSEENQIGLSTAGDPVCLKVDGTLVETIDRFFTEELSEYQRKQISAACCDMGQAYIGAIEHWCPNATLVLDRFHIVKALNAAVDEVRKEQWREANKDGRATLKGLRWLLYRHSSTRKDEDVQRLKALYMNGNRRIYRTWVLSDEFEQFWEFKDQQEAGDFLDNWCQTANRSRLDPIKDFVKTIKKHKHRLCLLSIID